VEKTLKSAPANVPSSPPRQEKDTAVLMGLRIARLTKREFIEAIVRFARSSTPRLVTYLNAHNVNVYFSDPEYARLIDRADIVYADGQALVWASRFLGDALPERVSAADFFVQFCQRCADAHLTLFLLGSRPGVAERAQRNLERLVRGLRIVGTHHGHFQPADSASLCDRIRSARPDILIVGMGVPRQEKWLAENLERLAVPVCWCVGALFEYLAGVRKRAPRWVRRAGCEWLFRLLHEPRRLWRRYLIGNLSFLIRVLRHKLKPRRTSR
jgi:N-acetylglucosaminyldiphosphoundecaprenol N-acetyl-beta-D-mannosaminyltransferase